MYSGNTWAVLEDIKRCGFDGVEIPIFEGTPDHYAELGRELERSGSTHGDRAVPERRHEPDRRRPAQREAALKHMEWMIECTAAMGASRRRPVAFDARPFLGRAGARRRTRAGRVPPGRGRHRQEARRVRAEAINRFECYFVNTMTDLAAYLDAVDHPNISGMYDTFHANIEEKHPVAAVAGLGRTCPTCMSPRTTGARPGRAIRFRRGLQGAEVAATMAGSRSRLSVRTSAAAAATRVWRDFFPTPTEVYREGYTLIRNGWRAA